MSDRCIDPPRRAEEPDADFGRLPGLLAYRATSFHSQGTLSSSADGSPEPAICCICRGFV